MWKCIRCEKENQDVIEQCENCGHGRTMDYTGYRAVSKLGLNMVDNWKYNQNSPEYLRKQAVKYMEMAAELLEKSGLSANKINEVMTNVCSDIYFEKRLEESLRDLEIYDLVRSGSLSGSAD